MLWHGGNEQPMFSDPAAATEPRVDVKLLHAEIGELTLEHDFFRRSAQQGSELA
jgi:hypothetical protein